VRDHGPGIPSAERKRVLQRFYRLERSRTTPGNGLGLSLVEAVVQLHGVELALMEAAPGLAVELKFPALAAADAKPAAPRARRVLPSRSAPSHRTRSDAPHSADP
jgi:signal transduction histidine kinase